jgi:alcohol dehydrogenase
MRAVRLVGVERVEVAQAPDPVLALDTDAIVRVTHTAICGADLLPYHGYTPGFEFGTILGHEFVGVVESAGDALGGLTVGTRVVNTSMTSDGSCAHCRAGRPTQCASRALFGYSGVYPRLDGGQAELVRVPRADRCLWPVPDAVSSEDAVFVADILPTGFLAVSRAGIGSGDVVVVLGCGPVGLMAVLCAVGTARRVIAVDAIEARRAVASSLGALACGPQEAAEAASSRRRERRRPSPPRSASCGRRASSRSSARTSSPTSRSTTRPCSRRRSRCPSRSATPDGTASGCSR